MEEKFEFFVESYYDLEIRVKDTLRQLIKDNGIKSAYSNDRCLSLKGIYPKFDEIIYVPKTDNLILANDDAKCSLSIISLEELCRITDKLNKY